MNESVRSFLSELGEKGRVHDASGVPHARRSLNLEADTGELLSLLLRVAGARRVLEIGTSTGVSAIWIADVLASVDGSLISIEREREKQEQAARNLASVELDQYVTLLLGDATEVVRALPGPFDCVFFDADRVSAPQQVDLLLPKLTRPGLFLADNALSHPEEIAGYLARVRAISGAETSIVPVGKGLSVTYVPC